MKIGVTSFACDSGRSGIGQYLIRLIREFPGAAPNDTFEVMLHEDEQSLYLPGSERVTPCCISPRVRSAAVNTMWHQVGLPYWCARRRYDALFIPAGNRRLPVYAPCPTVGAVHDFASFHVQGKYDPIRDLYIRRVLPFLVRRLTRVITASESARQDIVEVAGIPENQITIIPHGVDHDAYHPRDPRDAQARMRAKYPIRPPYLICVARIEHPGKNHVRLIDAFAQLRTAEHIPHQLVLVGSDWARAEVVHEAADKSGCGDAILFLGFVPTSDLPDLYCGADLFVLPSLYEGFGIPCAEAMACGVPVACSNVSSLPEVVGEAARLFDPQNEDSIGEALRALLTDAGLRGHCAAAGLERCKRYTWRAAAEQTLEVIHQAARANNPSVR